MTRASLLLCAVAWSASSSTGSAQNPSCSLEWGVESALGIEWYTSAAEPLQFVQGRLRVQAEKGSWTTLLVRVRVDGPPSPELTSFYAAWGQLAPVAPTPAGAFFPPMAGQPDILDVPQLLSAFSQGAYAPPSFTALDDDACRAWFVPHLQDSLPTQPLSHRTWSASPLTWTHEDLNPGLIAHWQSILVDAADPEIFSTELLAKTVVMKQLTAGDWLGFFNEDSGWKTALTLGLFVDIQAVTFRSGDITSIGTNDLNAEGLLGLEFGHLPNVNVSGTLTVRYVATSPLQGGGGSGLLAIPAGYLPGQTLIVPNRHSVYHLVGSPLHFEFPTTGSGIVNAPVRLLPTPGLANRFRVTIPANAESGPVKLRNAVGDAALFYYNHLSGNVTPLAPQIWQM